MPLCEEYDLHAAAELLPADRRFIVRALPASRTLTEPTPVSGKELLLQVMKLFIDLYSSLCCAAHPGIEGHMDAIFASPSEFIDNSLRALRGSVGNKKIAATFSLESHVSSGSEGEPGLCKVCTTQCILFR